MRRAIPASPVSTPQAAVESPSPTANPAADPSTGQVTIQEANDALQSFFLAKDPAERLKGVLEAKKLGWDVERFFKANGENIEIMRVETYPDSALILKSGATANLFRVTTNLCPDGALALMYAEGEGKKPLLDWTLFGQSHDYHFDEYVNREAGSKKSDPKWFTLLCRRTHDFSLKGVSKERYFCLEARGSLSRSGTATICVNKDSVAGRYLSGRLEWNRVYVLSVLLGDDVIDGEHRDVVLDSEGTGLKRSDTP